MYAETVATTASAAVNRTTTEKCISHMECTENQVEHLAMVRCANMNPLDSKGNYSATSTNTKLVDWPLMGGLLHLVQRGGAPPSPLLAVPDVTAHPSTASVPITVVLYDGPLLCGFNVAVLKG